MKQHHFCANALLLLTLCVVSPAQQSVDVSKLSARPTLDWHLPDGVIYDIYPRAFSAQGDLNGVTARLDDLKTLGRKHSLADAARSNR